MLQYMFNAQVGDIIQASPTVVEQDAEIHLVWKQLFFPLGTMANQTALKLHTT
jgi:threonine aldolase